ncbi:hypothetical protein KKG45_08045 [bacterium]|nr:hypothetical protein [bacterium]MBU1073184.1 hypothetical protein [bacterium]MBU1675577.1 hypothetical protein [bacterium]
MKRIVIVLAVFVALAIAATAGAFPQVLTITPAAPTSADTLLLHMDVTLPTPCYGIRNAVAYLTGDVLHLDYEIHDPGLYDCIQVIAEGEFAVAHGPLPAGQYQVVVRERQYYGPLLVNEFHLYGELAVTGAQLQDERLTWSRVKASYR